MISIIIPFHNGGEKFYHCLETLKISTHIPGEVIVVNDASTDTSLEIAQQFNVQVLEMREEPKGPATARNRGAAAARGEVLVFLDADVLVHPQTLEKIDQVLTAHPEVAAVFGSYDSNPLHRGTISLYKNLQHHYVHHHSQREASTFWAGCGAIRRDVFLKLGGFDESYKHPSVEDIELGIRMAHAGYRIWLCPEIQVTHLKEWTLFSWLRSDILDRAFPWTRLILATSRLPSDLNLNLKGRVSALVAWICVAFLIAGFWVPPMRAGLPLGIAALAILNIDFYRFLLQKGGILFAIRSFGLHTFYNLYSSLSFVALFAWYLLTGVMRARPNTALAWLKRISG